MRETETHLFGFWRTHTSGETSIERLGEGPEFDPSSIDESMLGAERALRKARRNEQARYAVTACATAMKVNLKAQLIHP